MWCPVAGDAALILLPENVIFTLFGGALGWEGILQDLFLVGERIMVGI